MSIRDRRIVVVNDDGIDARGLSILEQAARHCCDDVWVVAPARKPERTRARAELEGRRCRSSDAASGASRSMAPPPTACSSLSTDSLGEQAVDLVVRRRQRRLQSRERHRLLRHRGRLFRGGGTGRARHRLQPETTPGGASAISGLARRACPRTCFRAFSTPCCSPRRVLNVNFPALADGEAVAGVEVTHSGWRVGPTLDRGEALDPRAAASSTSTRFGKTSRTSRTATVDLVRRGYVTVTPLGLDQTRHEESRRHAGTLARRVTSGGRGEMTPGRRRLRDGPPARGCY